MRLDHMTWPEVETYLARHDGIILPAGSIEQHGPMGLIGTDAFCAELIAGRAAERAGALVAPVLAYAPAPFNTAFPGTVSISAGLYEQLAREVFRGLAAQGFGHIYVLNAHGANIAPLQAAAAATGCVRIKSWWEFDTVNALRDRMFGSWEGMHATPSEISITQAEIRHVESDAARDPPARLPPGYAKAHAGDRHGPPDEHRSQFPDGRVGSHSALAAPALGRELLDAAAKAVAKDYLAFVGQR